MAITNTDGNNEKADERIAAVTALAIEIAREKRRAEIGTDARAKGTDNRNNGH